MLLPLFDCIFCWLMLLPNFGWCYFQWFLWLMLLPFVADVFATYCLLLCWLMLLPMADVLSLCGRWNSHFYVMGWCYCPVADGIATGWNVGRCYCPSGRWNNHWVNYFSLSSLLLLRTSSHIWGRWYLPMFLFRDGPLTLMHVDSLISLERFCSSLPTTLKLSSVVVWPEVLLWSWMGEGALRCSLNLSPNVLDVSPMYSSSHSNLSHLNL